MLTYSLCKHHVTIRPLLASRRCQHLQRRNNNRLFSTSSSIINWTKYKSSEGLPPPSDEQKIIIEAAYAKDCNIQVNAVAGSGKTTTILHIANTYKLFSKSTTKEGSSILALVYNAKLKTETREKKKKFKLNNLEVHNFHAFVPSHYSVIASDDKGMNQVIKTNKQPTKSFSYELIIIDEIQDMQPIFFNFLCKIIYDNSLQQPCQLMVLG